MYSWQIATPWSAKSGVLSKYTSQLSAQNEIDEYIETKMPHRFDDGHGYDRVYRGWLEDLAIFKTKSNCSSTIP